MKITQIFSMLYKLIRYNLKIIFAGKFIWFILASFVFFAFFLVQKVWNGGELNEEFISDSSFFPGLLLVFYPSVFGIQNDEDSRILEILFGIPNYRYKVWLLRLVIIYLAIGLILICFGFMADILVCPVSPFTQTFNLMFPLIFIGNLAFMLSTQTRSGNGTAVVLIIIMIALLFMISTNTLGVKNSFWNIFLNPYQIPDNIHPMIWESTLVKNKLFLIVGGTVWLLLGLLNLQKREKFV